MIRQIRDKIIDVLKTIPDFDNHVYGYAKLNIERFPTAIVLYKRTLLTPFTNHNAYLDYTFSIQIAIEAKQGGYAGMTDKVLDIIDATEDAFLNNQGLDGGLGLTLITIDFNEREDMVLTEGKIMWAEFHVKVRSTKPIAI